MNALGRRRASIYAGSVWLAVVVLDILTKAWATEVLADGDIEVIPGVLTLHLTSNSGAAFGLFQGGGPWLGMVALIAVALVVYALGSVETRYEAMALGGIMGGAVGNLLDRLTRGDGWLDGRVVDWIDLIPWPTFNIADSAITISAAVLVIAALMKR